MDTECFTTLIQSTDLQRILDRDSTIVIDVRFSLADPAEGSALYASGHIPGASYLHLDNDLSGDLTPSTGRHPLPDVDTFADTLRRCGAGGQSQIIAYDQGSGAFAARLWWLCKWLGHEQVAVLDGGLAAWQTEGFSIDQAVPALPHGDLKPCLRDGLCVTAAELKQAMERDSVVLIDARATERFRGEVEPIDRVAGHIPGAINVPFTGNLGASGTFLTPTRLAERHTSEGDTVHMCGSGVTACHNILATVLAGHAMPRLYAGSWSEWITDPTRAVATGD